MPQSDATGQGISLRPNFEKLYQGHPTRINEVEFRPDPIAWDIPGPQSVIVEVERSGEIVGPVLDAGCGLGENALFLAECGYQVTAFDFAPSAIEQATRKARARGLEVTFMVDDATMLEGVGRGFRSVVDSALLHALDEGQQRRYLAALHRVCEPRAWLHILCFTEDFPFSGFAKLSEDDLRSVLADGWIIERLRRRKYTTAVTQDSLREQIDAGKMPHLDTGSIDRDDAGRFLMPAWQVTARRR